MLETKCVDTMKFSQDTLSNPPSDATIATLVQRGKDLGCTHMALSHPFGLSNTVSEMQRWATAIHTAGLKVLWRCDDPSKHPMYNQPIAVGGGALPLSTYQSRVDSFIRTNPTLFADGDEWAIYYESTSYWSGDGKVVNFFNQPYSWLNPNSNTNLGTFFTGIINTSQTAFTAIGKNVKVGLSSLNGSEFLNKFVPQALVDKAGYICTDHYVDLNPTQMASDLRAMKANYGKPVYLQETAVNRNAPPTSQQITDYFTALNSLVTDGTLTKYSYWGLWNGNEGLLNADLTLNSTGLALKTFFGTTAPPPVPTPPPVDLTPRVTALETQVAAINAKLAKVKTDL